MDASLAEKVGHIFQKNGFFEAQFPRSKLVFCQFLGLCSNYLL